MKINDFLKNRKTLIVIISVALVAVLLGVHTLFTNTVLSSGDDRGDWMLSSKVDPRVTEIMQRGSEALREDTSAMTENTVSSSTSETKAPATGTTAAATTTKAAGTTAATRATTRAVTQAPTASQQENIPFATAVAPAAAVDYSEQWDLGYLLAVDNPDTTYACAKINLTDEDRSLLENLCYGEFGTGGFIGASLIAQCVKDAMCFDGYTSVAEVIRECRYDGSTDIGTNDECRQAVRYIFDENHDAVQHRMLYMYNPYMVQSSFHESQNFILSYAGVRFFDRWGA